MEVQDMMRNWYGHMVRREEHCVGRMTMEMYGREERPKIRLLDGVRVVPKRRDCQGGSVRPTYIIRRTPTHKTVGLK